MVISELKTGMVIEFTNGSSGTVMLGTAKGNRVIGQIVDFDIDGDYNTSVYNEIVNWEGIRQVKRVLSPVHSPHYTKRLTAQSVVDVVWERKKITPKHTMQELFDKLGYEFEIKG
jgi:hypothetical protein